MRLRVFLPCVLSAFVLSGCGRNPDQIAPVPGVAASVQPSGSVHGGNQPVTGATVQLWQIGTTGYGSTPSALGAAVTSGAGGAFTLGSYTCPSSSTLVYLTATGGNPGLVTGTNNSALVMLAALGPCGSLSASTFTNINEVSTVAAVYALQQFMSPVGSIGFYQANTAPIANAFATVNNLINTSTGTARSITPNGNGIVPQAEINTLANALVPCVNSAGPTSAACAALFAAATPAGGPTPGNTLSAALSIAQNPGQNQAAVFNLATPNPAFQPALAGVPNDWTLALSYSTGASAPFAIAIDGLNNIWVANAANNSLSVMSFLGVPASNSPYTNAAYINNPEGIAVDSLNHLWMANFGSNSAMEFGLAGNAITTVSGPYSGIGLAGPNSVAVDGNNDIWFGNFGGNSVTELPNDGAGSATTILNIPKPNALSIDASGNVWAVNFNSAEITEIPQSSGTPSFFSGGGLNSPSAIAVGTGGALWVTDASLNEVSELSSSGAAISPSNGFTGGGIAAAYGVAIDGNGNVWIADNTANQLTELNSAGTAISPSAGYQAGSLSTPRELAIDASGNIWVANRFPASVNSAYQAVTEFIGLAAPANMPLVNALQTNTIARRPGSVSINSTGINTATLNSPYSYTFNASGGNGSYTWSITSGLAGLQAIGLSFSTGGVLSGTPTAVNNYPFSVQVTDTGTGQTASASFTLTVLSPPQTVCTHDGSGNAILNGNYAFLMSGFNPSGHFYDTIGDFKANGTGVISSGNADVNGDPNIAGFASGEQQYTFSGSYSVGSSDNRGILTVTNTNTAATGLPASTTYCLAADTITNGVAYSGHIIQADQSGFVQTGFFTIQNPTTFANSAVTGGYAFGMQGVAGTAANRRGWIGQFTASGNGAISSGQLDTSSVTGASGSYVDAYSAANVISASSYSIASNGRGTMTFNVGGVAMPFIVYTVGTGQQLYILSANASASATTPLLVGHAIQQTTTSYTIANAKANGVFRFAGTTNPNTPPLADNVAVGQITFDGAGNFAYLADENSGGSISTPAQDTGSGTYTVSSIGYATLSGGPHFYLWAPGAGFGLDSSNSVDLFFMLPQTVPSGGFSSANLSTYINGNYAAGTMFPSAYSIANNNPTVFDLFANFTSGTVSLAQDEVAAPATSGYILTDVVSSNAYALDPTYGPATGRVIISGGANGGTVVGYIISPTQSFLIQTKPGNDALVIQGDHW